MNQKQSKEELECLILEFEDKKEQAILKDNDYSEYTLILKKLKSNILPREFRFRANFIDNVKLNLGILPISY